MRCLLLLFVFLTACEETAFIYDDTPTFHEDVAPMLAEHCGACHQSAGVGPFVVDDYDVAAPMANAMLREIEAGTMPPFDAVTTDECAPPHDYKNDPSLPEADVDLLRRWIAADKPEGDPALAPTLVAPDNSLENPNVTISMQEPYTLEGDQDVYRCFRLEVPRDPGDVWITGVQVVAGNTNVVHHVLVWSDPLDESADKVGPDGSYPCSGTSDVWPTELIGTWVPGAPPTLAPTGAGTQFKEGATVVINVHYHPTGDGVETDQTSIELKWTTEQPDYHTTYFLLDIPFGAEVMPGEDDNNPDNPEFRIPAGAENHVETLQLDTGPYLPFPVKVFAIMPHMHFLGTDMKVSVLDQAGNETCMAHTPAYRFDFQNTYFFDAEIDDLPTFNPGDIGQVRCTYNNSFTNPAMEEALLASGNDQPKDVFWGLETGDEMCMAGVGLIMPPVDLTDVLDGFW
jgi:hypothetical protein